MPDVGRFAARTAFGGLIARLPPPPADPGVVVHERTGLGLATVIARRGQREALARRIRERYGIDLPLRPACATGDGVAVVATGPGAWLVIREGGGNRFARDLTAALAGLASVSDQSDGHAVLRLGGRNIRATLAKGLAIDLHPRRFRAGNALSGAIEHIGVVLWQASDAPVYEVALFRSFAGSFWHWLVQSAAEFGLAAGNALPGDDIPGRG